MTPSSAAEEYNVQRERIVELAIEARRASRVRARRSYAAIGVAAGLAVVGILIAATIVHDNARDDSLRARDEAIQAPAQ
jgi:hypothetical protein